MTSSLRTWPKIQANVLAYGKTIGPVNTKQAGALQTDFEARLDLWHAVMGMNETEQLCCNTEIPK
jgi:hypothetical protein